MANPAGKNRSSDAELRAAVAAYEESGGNLSAAARALGVHRITLRDRLDKAPGRLGIKPEKPLAGGKIAASAPRVRRLPRAGHVRRYIFTSAQNNTHLHRVAWDNLQAYRAHLDALPTGDCELMVGTFSYQMDAYGRKAVKRGRYKAPDRELWFDPEVLAFAKDESVELAPALVWCGEMNILPTAQHPLTGMETYNGRKSNIVPHAKIELVSVASLAGEGTKLNFSTGTVTQRNYVQKRVGIMAERQHAYGGLIVEVDAGGHWWVRQLHADDEGSVYDVGPSPSPPIRIRSGKVERMGGSERFVDSVGWGDAHAAEMALWVRRLSWGKGGMLDALRPRRQFLHDVFSMRARGHHDMKNFLRTYEKHVSGEGGVEDEMRVTADFVNESLRGWTETVVVPSNHHRHLLRWVNDADPNLDPLNARYHAKLRQRLLELMDDGLTAKEAPQPLLEWALREAGMAGDVRFLREDESFVICKGHGGGVECGLHGDLGPNGARGSTRNLAKLGRAVNKNHDHIAAIRDLVYSGGAAALDFPYMLGPSAHSISDVVTFENATRQIVTMYANKWRA